MNCKLVGRWRIVEADIWDRSHLDLCGSATIVIQANGRGEIAFDALDAALDIEYGRSSIADDGSIEIEFAYRNGDEAVLKAKRDTSSTAC